MIMKLQNIDKFNYLRAFFGEVLLAVACNELKDIVGQRKLKKLSENEGQETTETTKTWNRDTLNGNFGKSRDDSRKQWFVASKGSYKGRGASGHSACLQSKLGWILSGP